MKNKTFENNVKETLKKNPLKSKTFLHLKLFDLRKHRDWTKKFKDGYIFKKKSFSHRVFRSIKNKLIFSFPPFLYMSIA